ncbi:hypothetical protein NRK67_00545 [Fusobacteria bacterium ZRK30]|nr:hypothetical protein NRK67_00545 [Fusobacteria bacterium ZRK30]
MKIDRFRLNKIGIDRVVLNNFNIKNLDELEKKVLDTNTEISELVEVKEKLFTLRYSTHLKANNELYVLADLEFNPNTILEGHNLYNVRGNELKQAVEILKETLNRSGVEIDLEKAKVKTLEINKTIDYPFKSLEEVFLVIGRTNLKKSIGLYSFQDENIPRKIREERSLYINSTLNSKKTITGKEIKFYDKTFEFFRTKKTKLDMELTRAEVTAGRDYYREIVIKLGNFKGLKISNSLNDLIENDWVLDEIFTRALIPEVKIKPLRFIENVIKKNLRKEFINFRRTEKTKREIRKKYIENDEPVPKKYREEKGVFKYLKSESWIFDYNFLLEIVQEEIESKNRWRFNKQISDKYREINHLKRFEKFLEILNLR